MISFFEASLRSLSVHRVGNKLQDEYYVLSEEQTQLNADHSSLLMHYFLTPFQKVNEVYNLHHASDLSLNQIYKYSKLAFMSWEPDFHWITQRITEYLYEVSNHPKIKAGELYVAFFENVQIEGQLLPAVGIFKSELKETYLTVSPKEEGFELNFEPNAINIDSLDKGCLVFNTGMDTGFKVVCIDQNKKDASYWKDEFLGLQVVNNEFHQTFNMLSICKAFITDKLDEDFDISQAEKADILNKSVKYFKEKESFDMEEFSQEVLNNEDAISSFKNYKSIYDEEFDLQTPDSFDISSAAVKKKASSFKPVIKLDRNFEIHIHGSKELIERGFDGDKSMNFYKVYFKEEA